MTNTIVIYNTLNSNKYKMLIEAEFRISWGDATPDTILPMPTVYDVDLPYASHTYAASGTYDIEITVDSPWKVERIKRSIIIPLQDYELPTDFGVLSFTVPYSKPPITGVTQQYLEDYRTLTGNTDPVSGVTISFIGVGKSRLSELKYYGASSTYSGITTGTTALGTYTGYTLDGLYYMDYPDGITYITGNTNNFVIEELYQGMITRNEHLIGFLDEPQIYSDIFVERGKQGVMERNLRLGEIDSTGELDIYGSGYFKVRKQ